MKAALPTLLVLLLATFAAGEQAYQVKLVVFDSQLVFNSVRLTDSEILEPPSGERQFFLEIWDKEGAVLRTLAFGSSLNGPLEVLIPYERKGAVIVVLDDSRQMLFRFTVLQFADTCGDSICDEQESRESCQQDCPSAGRDDFCDREQQGVCDPDCGGQDPDCKAPPVVAPSASAPPVQRKAPLPQKSPASMGGMIMGAFALSLASLTAVGWTLVRKKGRQARLLRTTVEDWTRAGYAPQQIRQALLQRHYPQKQIDALLRERRGEDL